MTFTLFENVLPGVLTYSAVCLLVTIAYLVSPFMLFRRVRIANNRETLAGAYNALFTIPLLFVFAAIAQEVLLAGLFLCALMTLLLVFYALEYGHYLNQNSFYVIFETNPAESYDFLKKSCRFDRDRSVFLFITAVFCIAVAWLLPEVHPPRLYFLLGSFSALLLLSLLVPGLRRLFLGKPRYVSDGVQYEWKSAFQNLFILFGTSFFNYLKERRAQKMMAALCPRDIEAVQIAPERPDEEVHVLILGESAVRSHMGLYGYFRETTPRLQARADELFRFEEVISSHSATIASIRDMFTFCSYEDQTGFYNRGTLLQYIRKAGFDTGWVSNQCASGYNENFAAMLARSCDKYWFVNPSQHYSFRHYDAEVIAPLRQFLARTGNPRKFVVVHLMGQHFGFENRYPPEYARFTSHNDLKGARGALDQINAYDNATCYNDHVVDTIIELVKQHGAHASVLYLADHGIDLFEYNDTASQSEWDGTPPMFQIPFVLWLSEAFRTSRPDLVALLPDFLKRRFMTDDLIYSLPDLLGFSFPSHDAARSIFRPEWTFRKRIIVDGQRKVDRRDYDKEIAVMASDLEFRRDLISRQDKRFRRTVWAHECNRVAKLRETEQIFAGVEMDLVYDVQRQIFDVTHPPEPTRNLKLEDALSGLADPRRLEFWFDLKNLTPEHAAVMCERLAAICSRFDLPTGNTIIESQEALSLAPFIRAGFRTSYYLPTPFLRDLAAKSYRRLTNRDRARIESIQNTYASSGVWSVSLDGYLIDYVKHYLPEARRVLAWYEDKSPYDYFRRLEMQALLAREKRLKVLLVKHPMETNR